MRLALLFFIIQEVTDQLSSETHLAGRPDFLDAAFLLGFLAAGAPTVDPDKINLTER